MEEKNIDPLLGYVTQISLELKRLFLIFLPAVVCRECFLKNQKKHSRNFLQEPTSGLDSSTAYALTLSLKKYAVQNKKTVMMTIHQPSIQVSSISLEDTPYF